MTGNDNFFLPERQPNPACAKPMTKNIAPRTYSYFTNPFIRVLQIIFHLKFSTKKLPD
jgi:hypothetical protein